MQIRVANAGDAVYVPTLVQWYEESAKMRGIGIAKRNPDYLGKKMTSENAIIAFVDDKLAGFCYIEYFENGDFVVNSGLIVHSDYRAAGLGRKIKFEAFRLSRHKFPKAKIFGITTNLSVMGMNTELGYKPVTFSKLTSSNDFWKGCQSCKYHHILMENERKLCLCTGMVFDDIDKPIPPGIIKHNKND